MVKLLTPPPILYSSNILLYQSNIWDEELADSQNLLKYPNVLQTFLISHNVLIHNILNGSISVTKLLDSKVLKERKITNIWVSTAGQQIWSLRVYLQDLAFRIYNCKLAFHIQITVVGDKYLQQKVILT